MSEINLFNDENDFRSENQNLSNNAGQSDEVQFESYLQNNDNSNGIDESDNDSLSDEAKRLVAVMNFEGMNLSQFSQALGIKISTLSHLVNGRNRPSLDIMQRALRRFDYLTADWLILGRGKKPFGDTSDNKIDFKINDSYTQEYAQEPTEESMTTNDNTQKDDMQNDNMRKDDMQNNTQKDSCDDNSVRNPATEVDEIVSRVVDLLRQQIADKFDGSSESKPSRNDNTPHKDKDKIPMQVLASQEQCESRADMREHIKPVVTKIIVFYSDNTFEQFTK